MNFIIFNPRALQTLLITVFVAISFSLAAQMQVVDATNQPFTPENLITNVFLGNGVEVTDVKFEGEKQAIGYFSNSFDAIGIEKGLVLTTGRVEPFGFYPGIDGDGQDFLSSNNNSTATDADLFALLGSNSEPLANISLYTIKFIPTSDTVRFRYCFASEEYPEYSCSEYNDVFGFFIKGPGYANFTNIALVPGSTEPVAINTVHPFNNQNNVPYCPPKNEQYYNNNIQSTNQPIFDGFTDVFVAQAAVTPCVEYTIKLAIGDVSDKLFDSGVFLEAKSFSSKSLNYEILTESNDDTIIEGCAEGMLVFEYSDPVEYFTPLDLHFFGTGDNNIDVARIPSNLAFNTGETRLEIPLSAFEDNLIEGLEYIGIDFLKDACTRDTLYVFIKENALLAPDLPEVVTLCQSNLSTINLDGTSATPVSDTIPFSNSQIINIFPTDTAVYSDLQVSGVQSDEVRMGVIESVCINIEHNFVEDLDIFLIAPDNRFIELSTDNGGNGDNYFNTCFQESASQNITDGTAPFTGTFQPEGDWLELYGSPTNGRWRLQVTDDNNTFNGEILDWKIIFAPSYSIDYEWTPATSLSCSDCPITIASPTESIDYVVQVNDSYGCQASDTLSVEVVNSLAAPIIDCISPTANTVTFDWENIAGATGYQINVNGSGWQNVPANQTEFLVDGLGSYETVNVEIQAVGPQFCTAEIATDACTTCDIPSVSSNINPTSCSNTPDGAVSLVPNGFNPPYTFSLDIDTNSTGVFNNLEKGHYDIIITDQRGCTTIESILIPAPDTLIASALLSENVHCAGEATGSAQAISSGGTGQVTFLWGNGQSSALASNLSAGIHSVQVTDSEGCIASDTVVVGEPAVLVSQTLGTDAACFGTATGKLNGMANGGTAPYEFTWSNGQTGATIENVLAGTYSVIISDANGCTTTESLNIGEFPEITLTAQADSTSCHDSSDGKATISASGGASGFLFLWNDNQSQNTNQAINLAAGMYSVIATDANNCTSVSNVEVHAPEALSLFFEKENTKCNGSTDGTALAKANGGTAPYSYAWSNGSNTHNINSLGADVYSLTISDFKGCTYTNSIEIEEPITIAIGLNPTSTKCATSSDGAIESSLTGGVGSYNYIWSSGQSTANINQVPSGTYTLTATDQNGCTNVASASIPSPPSLDLAFSKTDMQCYGEFNGTASIQGGGGAAPYTYLWESGETTVSVADLGDGPYSVTITDAKGCTEQGTVYIEAPEALHGKAEARDAVCYGQKNGRIQIECTGGTPPYRYSANGDQWNGSSIQIALAAGMYTPHVMDKNGCVMEFDSVEVQSRGAMTVDLGPDITIQLGENIQLDAVVSNAIEPLFVVSWSPEDSVWLSCLDCLSPMVDSLQNTNDFEITVIDSSGCSAEDEIRVHVLKDRRVFVPTGFTPNGDFSNDLLVTHGDPETYVHQFRIYDRWGELVYEANDFQLTDNKIGWDGRFRGENLDSGVFVWTLDVEYIDFVREVHHGTTTLIR